MGQNFSNESEDKPIKDSFFEYSDIQDSITPKYNKDKSKNDQKTKLIANVDTTKLVLNMIKKSKKNKEEQNLDILKKMENTKLDSDEISSSYDDSADSSDNRQLDFKYYKDKKVNEIEKLKVHKMDISKSSSHPVNIKGQVYIGSTLEFEDLSPFKETYPVDNISWLASDQMFQVDKFYELPLKTFTQIILSFDHLGKYIQVVASRKILNTQNNNTEEKKYINLRNFDQNNKEYKTVKSFFTVGPITINKDLYDLNLVFSNQYILENIFMHNFNQLQQFLKNKADHHDDTDDTEKAHKTSLILTSKQLNLNTKSFKYFIESYVEYSWISEYLSQDCKTMLISTENVRMIYTPPNYISIISTEQNKNKRSPIILEVSFDQWVYLNLVQALSIMKNDVTDFSIDEFFLEWLKYNKNLLLISKSLIKNF